MTNCNINIGNSETSNACSIQTIFQTLPRGLEFYNKMNTVYVVKYSINRVNMFAFAEFNMLLNSREMDRNNRVDPLYRIIRMTLASADAANALTAHCYAGTARAFRYRYIICSVYLICSRLDCRIIQNSTFSNFIDYRY